MDFYLILGTVFFVLYLIGFYLAYLYGRKAKRFHWKGYFALTIAPMLFLVTTSYFLGIKILGFFIVSAFLGFFMDYIVGLAYRKTLHEQLWTYNRLNVDGYTSFLSLPFWGVGGIIFWFISKVIGI